MGHARCGCGDPLVWSPKFRVWSCARGCFLPNPGPQTRFLSLTCFEAGYGGSAGGGKSAALLVDAVRYVGRGFGPNYAALLLRREFPDLEKSLIVESHKLYPRIGGRYNENKKTWTFPGGELVWFGHAQHERDIEQYQGAAMQFVGFDELTTFTEYQYKYIFSRVRSAHGVPCRIRATMNPGGIGHAWVRRRFWPWLGLPVEERRTGVGEPYARSGEVRYFVREGEEDAEVTRDAAARLLRERDAAPAVERDQMPLPTSRTFIRAKLSDNPFLSADGEYRRGLQEMDPVTRARLENGDWDIREARGEFFKREWFTLVDAAPAEVVARVRYWDRAATEEPKAGDTVTPSRGRRKSNASDPDWTAGVLMSITAEGVTTIEHVERFRAGPGAVMKRIKATAEMDGAGVEVCLEQDPGQAGKFETATYALDLVGFDVHAYRPDGDKVTRAKPLSAQVSAGNVRLVRAPWTKAFIDEAEEFPTGSHDDQIDGASGAFRVVAKALAKARALGLVARPGPAETDALEDDGAEDRIARYGDAARRLRAADPDSEEALQLAAMRDELARQMTAEERTRAEHAVRPAPSGGPRRVNPPRRGISR